MTTVSVIRHHDMSGGMRSTTATMETGTRETKHTAHLATRRATMIVRTGMMTPDMKTIGRRTHPRDPGNVMRISGATKTVTAAVNKSRKNPAVVALNKNTKTGLTVARNGGTKKTVATARNKSAKKALTVARMTGKTMGMKRKIGAAHPAGDEG